ncbi:hypothetical protein F5051DRAFT_445163 [Lentinula edodes]|nr:hypothetical protein F5051DRAFT_445163 [Lentinula edodes]
MSASRTQTTTVTSSSTTGASRSCPVLLPPGKPVEEDAAKKKAEEEAARKAAEEVQKQQRESSVSPRWPVVEIRKKWRKGKAKAQPVGRDPDDGSDREDDDNKDERAPCKQCRSENIPCQIQAGKRSSIICKPCHDAKVRCVMPWLQPDPSQYQPSPPIDPYTSKVPPYTSQVPPYTSPIPKHHHAPPPTVTIPLTYIQHPPNSQPL